MYFLGISLTKAPFIIRKPLPRSFSDAKHQNKRLSNIQLHASAQRKAFGPELSYVVVSRLAVGGADHTHVVAGMEVAQLQQHHGQVVHEQLGVHEGRGELDDTVVVLILLRTHRGSTSTATAGGSEL